MHQESALREDHAFDKRPRPVKAKVQAEARHLRLMPIVGVINGQDLKPQGSEGGRKACGTTT